MFPTLPPGFVEIHPVLGFFVFSYCTILLKPTDIFWYKHLIVQTHEWSQSVSQQNEYETPQQGCFCTHPDSQRVCILCQQCGTDDPPFMFGLLKVRVREEEEHLTELKDTKYLQTNFRYSPAVVCCFVVSGVLKEKSRRQAKHLRRVPLAT